MELLEGESLVTRLSSRTVLSVMEASDLLLPVVSAVAAAHDSGVIHRDLKPANIVFGSRGGRVVEPVVTDFGTSKLLREGEQSTATASNGMLGTLQYMAPLWHAVTLAHWVRHVYRPAL
jgi:serine/threonine protein kinase